jgi:hypothetical protein
MEATLAENGEESPAKEGSLRWIARHLLIRAGGDTAAAREVGDRLDGKPAQAIIGGDDDEPPVRFTQIELIGVRPAAQDS